MCTDAGPGPPTVPGVHLCWSHQLLHSFLHVAHNLVAPLLEYSCHACVRTPLQRLIPAGHHLKLRLCLPVQPLTAPTATSQPLTTAAAVSQPAAKATAKVSPRQHLHNSARARMCVHTCMHPVAGS